MATVHWLGTGLSTAPGIQRLAQGELPLVLWNRTPEKAEAILEGIDSDTQVRQFEVEAFRAALSEGDIAVSMLPGSWHPIIAQMCIDAGAHFASSSYIAPEMDALSEAAAEKGLSFVNEIGLDPGIDHLMAHDLVHAYKESDAYSADNVVSFRSYCGGFPKIPNDFRYKFSWSPLGVLKALNSPARYLNGGEVCNTSHPWDAISDYTARLPGGASESFQAYPNRDSLPFMMDYQFDPDWQVKEFVRGTLRLNGWSDAWADIFSEIESLEGEAADKRLVEMSDELWRTQAYDEGEPDRVVLCVELQAERDGKTVWHQSYSLDACGDAEHTAMARLVSTPLSYAIEALAAGKLPLGVSASSQDPELYQQWLSALREAGEPIERIDHLPS